jgi:hypothetical protein
MGILTRSKHSLDGKGRQMSMKTVRVRVHAGHLEPLEALELPEGAELFMHFHSETPTAGSPAAVLSAMRRLPQLEAAHVDELERVIEAGKMPVRSHGMFDPSTE